MLQREQSNNKRNNNFLLNLNKQKRFLKTIELLIPGMCLCTYSVQGPYQRYQKLRLGHTEHRQTSESN